MIVEKVTKKCHWRKRSCSNLFKRKFSKIYLLKIKTFFFNKNAPEPY